VVVVFSGRERRQGLAGVRQHLNAGAGKHGSHCPALHHHGGRGNMNKRDGEEGQKSTLILALREECPWRVLKSKPSPCDVLRGEKQRLNLMQYLPCTAFIAKHRHLGCGSAQGHTDT